MLWSINGFKGEKRRLCNCDLAGLRMACAKASRGYLKNAEFEKRTPIGYVRYSGLYLLYAGRICRYDRSATMKKAIR